MTDRWNIAEVDWPTTPFPLEQHLILAVKRGSEAHGTYNPPTTETGIDDRDILGIVVPPMDFYIGVRNEWSKLEVQAIKGPWDVVLYDARKFVRLLMAQNPNTLQTLWCEQEDYLWLTDFGRVLIKIRDMFKGRHAFHAATVGYARGQLYKMTHGSVGTGYMGEKRKALVERFGYDCKNAAHLIRLLHMGSEFHREGILHVRRTHDRDMLVAIKRGEWSLAQVDAEAEKSFHDAEVAYNESVLPEQVDVEAVNKVFTAEMMGHVFHDHFSRRSHRDITPRTIDEVTGR